MISQDSFPFGDMLAHWTRSAPEESEKSLVNRRGRQSENVCLIEHTKCRVRVTLLPGPPRGADDGDGRRNFHLKAPRRAGR